jgi:hypothetical protein
MRFAQILFGDSPAAFPTEPSLDAAVRRLSSVVERDRFLSGLRAHEGKRVFGSVSPSRVRLTWVTPLVSNIFRPRFVGRFEVMGYKSVLIGKFGVLPVVRAWASTFALVGALGSAVVVSQPSPSMQARTVLLLTTIGLSVSGFAAVRLSQWLTRNVRQNLAAFIRSNLTRMD